MALAATLVASGAHALDAHGYVQLALELARARQAAWTDIAEVARTTEAGLARTERRAAREAALDRDEAELFRRHGTTEEEYLRFASAHPQEVAAAQEGDPDGADEIRALQAEIRQLIAAYEDAK